MEIAWIGTGIMGAPMARNLIRAGHRLRLHNRTAKRAAAIAAESAEATVANNPATAAQGAEVVFVMVPDTPDVEGLVAQIEPALHKGQTIIDMSTVAPAAERTIAERLARAGIDYLDAPVSGGESGAIEGTLTIMAGGAEAAYQRALPLFQKLGRRVTHMGPPGSGQMTKLANQIAVALTLEATVEALALAERGGLDRARVLEAIGAGAAGSWQLTNLGPKIIAQDWRPGFFIKLIRKDLRLVADAARECGLAMPGLAMMQSMFNAAAAFGHDLDGTQAVADALDKLARVK
jgi:3-hydroxyisobutyrate dehydrogenase